MHTLQSKAKVDESRSLLPIDIRKDILMILPDKKKEEKTSGGIYTPEDTDEKYRNGKIVSMGPGTSEFPVTFELESKVMYYDGSALNFYFEFDGEGQFYHIIRSSDVIAVI